MFQSGHNAIIKLGVGVIEINKVNVRNSSPKINMNMYNVTQIVLLELSPIGH